MTTTGKPIHKSGQQNKLWPTTSKMVWKNWNQLNPASISTGQLLIFENLACQQGDTKYPPLVPPSESYIALACN
jgi:hypothetical protein